MKQTFLIATHARTDTGLMESALDTILVALSFEQNVELLILEQGTFSTLLNTHEHIAKKFLQALQFGLKKIYSTQPVDFLVAQKPQTATTLLNKQQVIQILANTKNVIDY